MKLWLEYVLNINLNYLFDSMRNIHNEIKPTLLTFCIDRNVFIYIHFISTFICQTSIVLSYIITIDRSKEIICVLWWYKVFLMLYMHWECDNLCLTNMDQRKIQTDIIKVCLFTSFFFLVRMISQKHKLSYD
jgi:hypothetical protein